MSEAKDQAVTPPDSELPEEDAPLCYVAGVRTGAVPERQLLFLSLDCTPDPAGPIYVLTREKARDLVESLRDSLAILDAAAKKRPT